MGISIFVKRKGNAEQHSNQEQYVFYRWAFVISKRKGRKKQLSAKSKRRDGGCRNRQNKQKTGISRSPS